jgi:tellurite resistance protein TehA-like permease
VNELTGTRRLHPHARPWSGAFNVVMATAIISTATHEAGLETLSAVFLWVAILAFAPLAVLDVGKARHPVTLLHRARDPQLGFMAFGFVADAAVLGTRINFIGGTARLVAAALLALGILVWLSIVAAMARLTVRKRLLAARGHWLLAVVATQGLAILAGRLAAATGDGPLSGVAVAAWAVGILLYLLISGAIGIRLVLRPLHARDLTPDSWIVMGAPAITALAGATLHRSVGGAADALALAGWVIACAALPLLVGAEIWRARVIGPPIFNPARWTTVFPLGMYSAASQLTGQVLHLRWMSQLGRWWLIVAIAAWLVVAIGEIHHALVDPMDVPAAPGARRRVTPSSRGRRPI